MLRLTPLLVIAVPFSLAFAQVIEYGYVVSAKGVWKDRKHDGPAVQALQLVYSDSELVVAQPANRAYLEIRFGDQVKSYNCLDAAVCSGPLKLPSMAVKPAGFFAFVLGVLKREGPPLAQLSSRGSGVADGLVEIRKQKVDLASLLATTEAGKYEAAWCADPVETPCGRLPQTFPLAFALDLVQRREQYLVPAPAAGLVRLLLKKPTEPWSAASEAWVVALASPRYEGAVARLGQAQGETANWSDPHVSTLLRLLLRDLAIVGVAPAK